MKPVESASVYPAIASIVEETINLLQGQENPYPYKRWQTLRKNVNINRSAQLMDRAITKASMTTYGKTLVPERLTIALNDSKPKWHVVQTLIWDKATTAIPEGQVKRFNSSYEEIIWCVKDPKNYYFDSDQIREPYKTKGATIGKPPRHHEKPTKSKSKRGSDDKIVRGYSYRWNKSVSSSLKHPLGKMKRDILRVNRATTQSIDFGGNVKHTSIMPVELVDTILAGVIRPGMLVVDPTCGSGTTGVSALGYGAYFCGYDLNDSFLELANHRMEQRLNELME